jgi:hypothetical protein
MILVSYCFLTEYLGCCETLPGPEERACIRQQDNIQGCYWHLISIDRTKPGATVRFKSDYHHGEHFDIILLSIHARNDVAKQTCIFSIIAHTIVSSFLA